MSIHPDEEMTRHIQQFAASQTDSLRIKAQLVYEGHVGLAVGEEEDLIEARMVNKLKQLTGDKK